MKGSKLRFLVYLSLVITLSGTQAVRAQALVAGSFQEQAQQQPSPSPEQTPQPSSEEAERAEIDAALNYVPVERIEKIKAFLLAHPNSTMKAQVEELLVWQRAAFGDEKLRAGDVKGALEQFRLAVEETPATMTEKLYVEVLTKIPLNLFLLGQRAGALEIARLVEARVNTDAARLLYLVSFYTSVEESLEAVRVSELAVKLAPDLAAAHLALATARHIALDLDGAALEYARALELDPKLGNARRTLADLRRASGRPEDALALYREQLLADAKDRQARAGVVLALLDLGKREDAERELEAALRDEPRNLGLLVGAAYWYAAHNEMARALELAQRAVDMEPRHVWAQVVLARALLAERRPVAAEQALRTARRYGRFPTLDYELANALAASGLYDEAAAELARTFTLRNDQIETQLAGRRASKATNFIELLTPERRASIFQATAADTDANARLLKALLAFNTALTRTKERESVKEKEAVAAALEFTAGDDAMRAFRQLYAANRLARAGVASNTVLDLVEAANAGIETAADAPSSSVSLMAEEIYGTRQQALATNAALPAPEIERAQRVKILRGRVDELAGWALLNQEKRKEAIERLRRAVGSLPENSAWWRSAEWRLGTALEASGEEQEALASYLRSYDAKNPNPERRAVIETLYRKLNGSLDGLEAKLGGTPSQTPTAAEASTQAPAKTETPTQTSAPVETPSPTSPAPAVTTQNAPDAKSAEAASAQNPGAQPTPETSASPTSASVENAGALRPTREPPIATVAEPTTTATPSSSPETSSASTEQAANDPAKPPAESGTAKPPAESSDTVQNPSPVAETPTPQPTPARTRSRRTRETGGESVETRTERGETQTGGGETKTESGECSFSIDTDTVTVKNNGGSANIIVKLTGTDKITPTTRDWPDVTVFAQTLKEFGSFPFIINSISKRTGKYTVTFTTPCGSKDVTVIVK